MKHIPPVLIALLLAGAVAACLASQRVYGQGVSQQPDAVQVWREAAARGLSYNESLALYRLRNSSTVPTPLHPRFQAGAGANVYVPTATGRTAVSPFHTGMPASSGVPTTAYRQSVGKPFENIRHPPSAFERYWPLMLEGREDPKTGVIIWSLP